MLAHPPLPIYQALPQLRPALAHSPVVVLQAPPGAGKSTALPLELLAEPWLAGQKILMLEPRRLAARAVAERMAQQLSEPLGHSVGYRVRFESRTSPQTRLEVVTEGVLTRRLQQDPALEGVGLVIFDEFHERSLQADLAWVLCRQAQSLLRPELRLLIMSATLESAELGQQLGAPVVQAHGKTYPVEVRYLPRDPEGPMPAWVAAAVSRALQQDPGDVLVFLPGVSEISRTQALLQERHPEVRVVGLYGDLNLDQQRQALLPLPQRKVVLATSIAETSLTVEGVGVVVDAGYARFSRFDPQSGLSRLETVRLTQDAADQRAGRAGRLGPGVAYRLWSEATQRLLLPQRKPEILEADLASLLLELYQWGSQPLELEWITTPPAAALRQAQELLQALGALQGQSITVRGRQMTELPTHPRIAHMLLESAGLGLQPLACDLAALLEERDPLPRGSGTDFTLRAEALHRWRQNPAEPNSAQLARVERLAAFWRQHLGVKAPLAWPNPYQVGALLALAYPDRIAQQREGQPSRYRLASGKGVRLPPDDSLTATPWLAVAHLDAAQDDGRVHLAAPLDAAQLRPLASPHAVVAWDAKAGVLIARREWRVGQTVLDTEPLSLSTDQRMAVLLQAMPQEGMHALAWSEALRQWQARVLSLRHWRGEPWPDVSDEGLMQSRELWLGPWLSQVSRREDLAKLPLADMLQSLLPWPLPTDLDRLAPLRVEVPSGSQIKVQYFPDGSPPVLAVRLQEVFGWLETPRINEGQTRLMLHLLSPAMRPVQVTQDLQSFWRNTYPQIRKELRGRYNKHYWPDDPFTATPTRKAKPFS